jgi:histidyl-tRNA synthetase
VLNLSGDNQSKLEELERILEHSETGKMGVSELRTLFGLIGGAGLANEVELDLTLARGLNYYTGAIFEVKSKDTAIGSICGGGRYDNLTGVFGMDGVSGVGISFGADRIYDVLLNQNMFEGMAGWGTKVLVINFGEKELPYALRLTELIRSNGISAELYPDPVKLKKQLSYAASKKIPFVVLAGEDEIDSNEATLRMMDTGEQERVPLCELGHRLK